MYKLKRDLFKETSHSNENDYSHFEASDELRKEILSQAYENLPHAMSITDENNKILYVNKAFTKLTGYTLEEVVGHNPSILSSGTHNREFYKNMWKQIQQHGRWSGEIWNRRKDGSLFLEEITIQVLTDSSGRIKNHFSTFRDITEKKRLEQKITFQAYHDDLTQLPNRNYFYKYLKECLQKDTDKKCAILFLDLDRFKEINDTLGHSVGDQLLKATAERLKNTLPKNTFITRYGGDEFVITIHNIKDNNTSSCFAKEILKSFEKPFILNDYELYITPSIGISIYPDDGQEEETLLKNADAAMYQAKQQGKNSFQHYKQEFNQKSFEKLMLASDLRSAITNNEFQLYYQPQICLRTKEMTGVEALLRWRHPTRGIISPQLFIPIAEEIGFIQKIDQWVLQEACNQLKLWQLQGYPPIKIAVNISMLQFQQKHFFYFVEHTLKNNGINPKLLEIELTESIIMDNPELTLNNIQQLNSIGVHISLDDFGTHYSSLAYLKKLSLNRIKIDRGFIRDLYEDKDDRIIVQAMINLAHHLNLKVVAEGVETKQQLDFLQSHDCDEIQGFYYGKPMPANQVHSYII